MGLPNHEQNDGAAHLGRAVVVFAHVTGALQTSPKANPLIP